MRKLKILSFLFLMMFPTAYCAAASYQRCSEKQQTQLIQKYHLNPNKVDEFYYTSCLSLPSTPQQPQRILMAISTPLTQPKSEDNISQIFNLVVYVIDPTLAKPISKTLIDNKIESDVSVFTRIELDTHAFSNIKQQDVVGIRLSHHKYGGFVFSDDRLFLLHVQPNQTFKKVLDLKTYDASEVQVGCGGYYSQVKRILIVKESQHNGFNDLQIKASKKTTEIDKDSCKEKIKIIQKQYGIQFNGQRYVIPNDKLEADAL